MPTTISTNDLTGEIYEASSRPEHWQTVLALVAGKINADSAMLIFRDFENPEADINFIHSNQSAEECAQMVQEYENYYHQLDPMWKLANEHSKVGVAIADSQLGLSREEYEAQCPEEYIENYMRKYDRWYIAGSYIFQDEEKALVIAVQRGINSKPWTDQDMDFLTSLTPHFQRAFRIHREFSDLRSSKKYLQSCVNRLLIGLIILKPNGKIDFINELAKRTLADNPVLIHQNDRLKATPAHNDDQLQKLLQNTHHAKDNPEQETNNGVTALSLRVDGSSAPLPMLVAPVFRPVEEDQTGNQASTQRLNHVAIFFADPEHAQEHSQDIISQLYDLTRAEAGVAIAISNGYTVAEYANRKNVAKSTVQTHVKKVSQKLNVSRQAEIVKVLLQTPNIVLNPNSSNTSSDS